MQQTCHDRGLPQLDGPSVIETEGGELFAQNVPHLAWLSESLTEISRAITIFGQPAAHHFNGSAPFHVSVSKGFLLCVHWGHYISEVAVRVVRRYRWVVGGERRCLLELYVDDCSGGGISVATIPNKLAIPETQRGGGEELLPNRTRYH